MTSLTSIFSSRMMGFQQWVIISACLLTGTVSAAPIIEIHNENIRIELPAYVDILEDPRGTMSIDDVSSEQYMRQFVPAPLTELFFGYTHSAYWLRFAVENQLDHDKALILEVAPADIDHVDIYGIDSRLKKVLFQKRSGSARGFSDRDYDHPLYYFDVTVPAHAGHVYFVRLESNKTINAKLRLSSPREHFAYSGMRDWWQGFLFGALLLLILAHAGLAFKFRYKGFAYCGLWLVSMVLMQGSWNGYYTQFLQTSSELLDRQLMFGVYFSTIFGLLFTRTYLDTHHRTPLAHRILTFFLVLAVMGIPCAWLFTSSWNAMLASLIAIPVSFFMFGLGIYSFLEGYEPARYFLLVRTITIVMILVAMFSDLGLLPDMFTITYGLAVSFVFEGLVFLVVMVSQQAKRSKQEIVVSEHLVNDPGQTMVPVAAFCHELRTPISGVMGMTELLLDTALSNQQRVQVESIYLSGKALLDVVNKMSDLASIENGEIELHERSFELITLVELCVENARVLSEQRNIELIYQVDEVLSGWYRGDEERLQQVLGNLINHGIRHMESGEILLRVKKGEQDKISFEVLSGRNTFFQEYGRIDEAGAASISTADSLGLTVSRHFIELMGGELLIQYHPADGGSRASFQISLLKQGRAPAVDEGELLLRGKCLVVVDDNDTCCKIVQQQAAQWGMEAMGVTSGKEAMALLRMRANLNQKVDLMLVDYDMPGMNGLEFLARLEQERESLNVAGMRIMILTGVNRMPAQLAENRWGVFRVLYKPLSGKGLKLALLEALTPSLQQGFNTRDFRAP